MAEERDIRNRTPNMDMTALIDHVQWKIDHLPLLASIWGLSAEVIQGLRGDMEVELALYKTLPPDLTLKDIMGMHFEGDKRRRLIVDEHRVDSVNRDVKGSVG